jgi:hypothetical protein
LVVAKFSFGVELGGVSLVLSPSLLEIEMEETTYMRIEPPPGPPNMISISFIIATSKSVQYVRTLIDNWEIATI